MHTCCFCPETAHYRDRRSDLYVCPVHATMEVVKARLSPSAPLTPRVRPATFSDRQAIADLALYFWGEAEVACFDRVYRIGELPAFIRREGRVLAGALVYALEARTLTIVMLNVRPEYQGQGIAAQLLEAARHEASVRGMERIAVATTNDDLPALALYQKQGFQLADVKFGRLVEHHGGEEKGFSGIAVRDEVRLECELGV